MNILLEKIRTGKQVSLARFNDGEVGALRGDLVRTSRELQKVDKDLLDKLRYAMNYRADGYFIGIPCPVCYGPYFNYMRRQLGGL